MLRALYFFSHFLLGKNSPGREAAIVSRVYMKKIKLKDKQ
jgi:hypothetical protein